VETIYLEFSKELQKVIIAKIKNNLKSKKSKKEKLILKKNPVFQFIKKYNF